MDFGSFTESKTYLSDNQHRMSMTTEEDIKSIEDEIMKTSYNKATFIKITNNLEFEISCRIYSITAFSLRRRLTWIYTDLFRVNEHC